MTPSPHRPRLAGLVLAIALIGLGAGCASKSGTENTASGETGSGQLGDVPATAEATPTAVPTPTSTSVGEDGTPDPVPTAAPKLTLIINPTLLLASPSPADCVTYNPTTVTISYAAPTQTWSIVDGTQGLLVFKRQADADAGLALAKSYKKHCWIGRTNTRSNHGAYVMDYWLDAVAGAAAVPNPDCLPHTASQLAVASSGTSGWLVHQRQRGRQTARHQGRRRQRRAGHEALQPALLHRPRQRQGHHVRRLHHQLVRHRLSLDTRKQCAAQALQANIPATGWIAGMFARPLTGRR